MLRGLIVTGALVLGASALAPGSAAAEPSYSVLQINICNSGKKDEHGKTLPCYSGRATTKTVELIIARTPSVVTVNEVCKTDLGPIEEKAHYSGLFTPSGKQTCENGSEYGNALLFPSGTSVGEPYPLTYNSQDSGNVEHRTLTCVPANGVTACVTHLSKHGDKAADQAAEMKNVVGNYARQGPTVLGGDWNLKYDKNKDKQNAQKYVPAGMFRKGDGDVQHIMASSAHFGFTSTRVMKLDWTDHPALQVYLTH